MELETACFLIHFYSKSMYQNNKLNIINRGDYVKI